MSAQATKGSNSSMDVTVGVTRFTSSSNIRLATKADPDKTEYSSSFVDTSSENDNGLSDAKVEWRFYDDSGCHLRFMGLASCFQ